MQKPNSQTDQIKKIIIATLALISICGIISSSFAIASGILGIYVAHKLPAPQRQPFDYPQLTTVPEVVPTLEALIRERGGQWPPITSANEISSIAPASTIVLFPTFTPLPTFTPPPTFTPDLPNTLPPTSTSAPSPTLTSTPPPTSTSTSPPTTTSTPSIPITVISITSPIERGNEATLVVETLPNLACDIYYVTPLGNPSEAEILGSVTAGSDGMCTFTWIIGGNTTPGTGTITIWVSGYSTQEKIEILE